MVGQAVATLVLDNGASIILDNETLIAKWGAVIVEQWKPVVGYEGLYEVSSHGNVYSMRTKKILRTYNQNGYLHVHLYKNGHRKNWAVHRLVANAFIPNPENLETVNHIDENKTNNHIHNLEWMSRGDNIRYSACNKVKKNVGKGRSKKVLCIETGQPYDSMQEAERQTGIAQSSISLCCNGKIKTAGGMHWCFC